MAHLYIHGARKVKTVDSIFDAVMADEEGQSLVHRLENIDALLYNKKDDDLTKIRAIFVARLKAKFGYNYDGVSL